MHNTHHKLSPNIIIYIKAKFSPQCLAFFIAEYYEKTEVISFNNIDSSKREKLYLLIKLI